MSKKHNGMHYALSRQSIGVVTLAKKKALFEIPVDHVHRFDAQWSLFFTEFDWCIVFTSPLEAYISRYGDFFAHDNDNDMTDYFTPCTCTRGKYAAGIATGQIIPMSNLIYSKI